MEKKKGKLLLVCLIVLLIAINYNFINSFLIKKFDSKEVVFVERVIDGDTVVVNGSSMRLLGINTPEKNEIGYEEAKEFLENLVLDKDIKIEKFGKDLYYRDLVYLFDFSGRNINLEIVENGFGNYYFPEGKDKYYKNFVSAWEKCLDENINLCEKSSVSYADCISVKEWNIKEDKVILENVCDFDCDLNKWEIKDEGRKKFIFENFVLKSFSEIEISAEDFNKTYVWTKTGDTIFIRDNLGKLVFWDGY